MPKQFKVACITQNPSACENANSVCLPKVEITWNSVLVEPSLAAFNSKVEALREKYDAVVVDGLPCEFRIGAEKYRVEGVSEGTTPDDGAGLRASLERYIVALGCDLLGANAKGKKAFVFSGLAHMSAAEVLNREKIKVVFGDLLFANPSGTTINSLKAFRKSFAGTVESVVQGNDWPWTYQSSNGNPVPVDAADILLGDQHAIQSCSSQNLRGKIVFTNLSGENDLQWFMDRGLSFVVSLTPVVDGKFVPLAVLEAALKHGADNSSFGNIDNYCLNQLQTLDVDVAVFDLRSGEPRRLEQTPTEIDAAPEAVDIKPLQMEPIGKDETARFAFVIHPLSFKHINRLKPIRIASQFFSKEVLEDATSHMKSFKAGTVKNLVSKTGAKAEGIIYAVPVTSKVMLRKPAEFIYKKLVKVARKAKRAGCSWMGLGAYTSVVGDAGVTVSQRSEIGITSGNSYTVAATLKTLDTAANRCGKDLSRCNGLVIGATGSIGSICSRMLAHDVNAIYLVAPRPEKLLHLAKQIEEETPAIRGKVYISRDVNDFLPMIDVAISTTSSVDAPIDVTLLKSGCIVCDVARPPDIKKEQALARGDIMVIEAGEINLLNGAVMNYDIGLPPGTVYACLAETMLLALDKRLGDFTLGREIDPAKVELIAQIGEKHGFELADIRSFGEIVPDEHFERLRQGSNL